MHAVARHLVKKLTVDETSNYHMTTLLQDPCATPPRVSPHAGTEVWSPPDALVPGVSPRREGLGMVEPSRSDPVEHLSNIAMTASSSVGPREEPTGLESTLQGALADHPRVALRPVEGGIGKMRWPHERRSGTSCCGLQVGYGCRSEDLPPLPALYRNLTGAAGPAFTRDQTHRQHQSTGPGGAPLWGRSLPRPGVHLVISSGR
jgi:hypothetical protein